MGISITTPGAHHITLRITDEYRAQRFKIETLGFPVVTGNDEMFLRNAGATAIGGINPLVLTAGEVMTSQVVTAMPDMTPDECARPMEHRIRRVPVVDAAGACVGIVALADVARHTLESAAGEIVRELSEPCASASALD